MSSPAPQSLYGLLEPKLTGAGSAPALVTEDGQVTSYAELVAAIGRMANALVSRGVAPGDRVMVQVEKSLTNVALYLATLKIGAVYSPLNTAYTAAELDYFISDAEPGVVVIDPARRETLEAIAAKHGVPHVMTLGADGIGSLSELAAGQSGEAATVARAGSDMAALLYTSGTTGRSKGAMITHENLASNARVLQAYWRFVPGDVLLHALPIFHVHGLFVALNTAFLNQSKIIWLPRFDVATVMRAMPEASVMMGVPTFYTRLLGDPGFGRAQCTSMRLVISGSAPLLAETHVAFEERTGHKILERYGMTEAGMITSNPYDGERIAGTVGYALPDISVRIADGDGNAVGNGDVGVLEVKGPNVFSGYWRNAEKTAAEFRPDGYFISGDLATMAADGRITIVGRAKDLIISGGFNVYPKEIEEELNEIEGVVESAVVGVPHPDFGEAVVAVLTMRAGANLDPADVLARLGGRLAKFKLPKHVAVLPDLPRNAMGKVQKNELRDRFKGLFAR